MGRLPDGLERKILEQPNQPGRHGFMQHDTLPQSVSHKPRRPFLLPLMKQPGTTKDRYHSDKVGIESPAERKFYFQ